MHAAPIFAVTVTIACFGAIGYLSARILRTLRLPLSSVNLIAFCGTVPFLLVLGLAWLAFDDATGFVSWIRSRPPSGYAVMLASPVAAFAGALLETMRRLPGSEASVFE